ncbi:hypothetical protein OHA18_20945 [Kribbella sp. NBC_00709]|nr:hypothetical protein [Kribbella sp. NBC_00709]
MIAAIGLPAGDGPIVVGPVPRAGMERRIAISAGTERARRGA